ncbi:MAG: hypothetical protein HKP55_05930 [Gammaproteobacteria bacterium]|nr:CNP1-like family protein [Gammaproteobacteria bacterium]NNJ91193.1 hypothetical protein [Gammaproteobacteria bacterium]
MSKKLLQLIVLLCAVALFPSGLFANEEYLKQLEDNAEFEYDDSGDVPWKEDRLADLMPPENDNLRQLAIDHPPVGFKVYIDTTSITVSKSDSVVRYWLVLKAGKSRNAMYEGIKCNSKEYKTYAYENKWKKGKVNISKVAKWLPIKKQGHDYFRYELEKYFFCSDVLPRPVEDIQDIIAGYKTTTSDFDPTYHYGQ